MWSPGYTLRELMVRHDQKLLEQWDHTASIRASLHYLAYIVIGATSKSAPKPKPPTYFHPFREKTRDGMVVSHDTFVSDFQMLGNAIIGSRKK